ncbi:DUF5685 family protein [Nocardia sp. NPDC004068]|uniref:DUF5685 family protein n=1 Tax=Nocardia sp. NPDC004068 TaxID=3364303 RepID=UPI0036978A52
MFGLLTPCAHHAGDHGIDAREWHSQLCGLCLGLRDAHGQTARAATNTDAVVLSILTEAQSPAPTARTTTGPCALRGLRRTSVAPADSPGVRLAATASLLLGAAKIRDRVDDGEAGWAGRPMTLVADRWFDRARTSAAPLDLDIEPLIAAIRAQAATERALTGNTCGADDSAPHLSAKTAAEPNHLLRDALDDQGASAEHLHRKAALDGRVSHERGLAALTAATQLCAAELFAHTAVLAGRTENRGALWEAGWHFGRIAHLADAIEDLDEDARRGRFNPLTATGTSRERAYELVRESDSRIRAALDRAGLGEAGLVRWWLLDPLRGVVRTLRRAAGLACGCARGAACSVGAAAGTVALLGQPMMHASGKSVRPEQPGLLEGIGIICTQYCTGYACCAEHTRPCSGERRRAWSDRCDCDCDPGCGDCGECCNCCDCGCDCGC